MTAGVHRHLDIPMGGGGILITLLDVRRPISTVSRTIPLAGALDCINGEWVEHDNVLNCLLVSLYLFLSPPFVFLWCYKHFPLWISNKIKLQNFRYRQKVLMEQLRQWQCVFLYPFYHGKVMHGCLLWVFPGNLYHSFSCWREITAKRQW